MGNENTKSQDGCASSLSSSALLAEFYAMMKECDISAPVEIMTIPAQLQWQRDRADLMERIEQHLFG